MPRSTTYTFEDSNGDLHDYDVVFTITKAYGGTWEQPPEPAEIEIISIQENGVEVDVVAQDVIEKIEQQIWNDDEEPDEYFGDLD